MTEAVPCLISSRDPDRRIGVRRESDGRATLLHDVTEALELSRRHSRHQADRSVGAVFFLISGLVIERGGMLSHSAIIAREFGIPCVVGVRNAMQAIPRGATITVDGDGGQVHVLG
jgi:pyruvate,water dikinase